MNIEYKSQQGTFPLFFNKISNKKVAVVYDVNTKPYAVNIINQIKGVNAVVNENEFFDKELIPDEKAMQKTIDGCVNADYLLAVGSGTLNDMAKAATTINKIECGVLATAASMDGYCSKGSALMRGGRKVTDEVHTPSDILIDLDIVKTAPKEMTAAGFGDIVGKFTCLTDWQMTNAVKGEEINQKAFAMMEKARTDCMDAFEELVEYKPNAIAKLMDALIMAGLAMAECGNSRPASGSEHHLSHFLEMDFVARGERVPLHGVKVAIGTLISIELYNYLLDNKVKFNGCEKVYELVKKLPKVQVVKDMLVKMSCPVRFSEIGVRKQTFLEMVAKAHTVRDRYTVLTLINELGLTEKIQPILLEKYF